MADLPEPSGSPLAHARASDADRDAVAEILREAAGDGRLNLDELHARLEQVYAAKTYGELAPITHDLPGRAGATAPTPRVVEPPSGEPTSGTGIAIMSGFERKGPWQVPDRFTAFAFWGGIELDMGDATFPHGEATINAVAIMAGISIVVPDDANVQINGMGFMGGFDHHAAGGGSANGPRIVVNGLALMAGVEVKRRPRRAVGPGEARELPQA
jgi:hypothetical protein